MLKKNSGPTADLAPRAGGPSGNHMNPARLLSGPRRQPISHRAAAAFRLWFIVLLPAIAAGCRTTPLPRVDLAEPGWTAREGQAVWQARRSAPEIAGDLLVATNREGRAFVQFTKTPFPLVVAQLTTNAWQIESPTENRRYSGRGSPPGRVLWLQLPRALAGVPLRSPWTWHNDGTLWRLENRSTGESLEGSLTP